MQQQWKHDNMKHFTKYSCTHFLVQNLVMSNGPTGEVNILHIQCLLSVADIHEYPDFVGNY